MNALFTFLCVLSATNICLAVKNHSSHYHARDRHLIDNAVLPLTIRTRAQARSLLAQQCAICLERDGNKIATNCSRPHVFHQECLINWLTQGNNSCPVCRQSNPQPTGISREHVLEFERTLELRHEAQEENDYEPTNTIEQEEITPIIRATIAQIHTTLTSRIASIYPPNNYRAFLPLSFQCIISLNTLEHYYTCMYCNFSSANLDTFISHHRQNHRTSSN